MNAWVSYVCIHTHTHTFVCLRVSVCVCTANGHLLGSAHPVDSRNNIFSRNHTNTQIYIENNVNLNIIYMYTYIHTYI